jgi:hypothetical protein
LGLLVLAAALAGGWFLRRETHTAPSGESVPSHATAGVSSPQPFEASRVKRFAKDPFPRPSLRELTDRHEIKPDEEEWGRLLGMMQEALPEFPSEEERDITEAVKARFAAHAGAAQLDELASLFQYSSSMEVGQNALEVLGALQSEDFLPRAREIVGDVNLSADDQVVTALARSLVRSGTPQDLVLILERINHGKTADQSEYGGMEGLMSAIHGALAEEMEPILCDVLSNKNESHAWQSRLAAAAALQNHSTSGSTSALSRAAENDLDPRVKSQAAESLAHLRTLEE